MNFKTKIGYYISTTDGYTDAEAKQYIVDGCYDVYRKFKSLEGSDIAQKFASFSSADTSGNALDIDEVHEILYVQRNGVPAIQVTPNQAHKYTNVNSMHYASVNDPIFYIQEKYLYIKPATSDSNGTGYYMYLPVWSVTNYDSSSSIDRFPAEYYDHVLKYAAFKIAEALAHSYLENDEDAELTQLMTARAQNLKNEYNEMFATGGMEK